MAIPPTKTCVLAWADAAGRLADLAESASEYRMC